MKKFLSYAVFGIAVFSLAAAGFASAHPGERGGDRTDFDFETHRAEMLERKSEVLGITAEELESRLEAGETFLEIAEAQGISEEELLESRKAHMIEKVTEKLGQAVESGRLTQEEADEKLAQALERIEAGDFTKGHSRHGGFGRYRHLPEDN